MINFRNIFNPTYNYIGLLIIIIIIILIIINNKNLRISFKQIGTISLYSSLFTLIVSILIKFILNNLIPYQYKLFVQVISENVFKYSIILSTIGIILGIILTIISKTLFNNKKKYSN